MALYVIDADRGSRNKVTITQNSPFNNQAPLSLKNHPFSTVIFSHNYGIRGWKQQWACRRHKCHSLLRSQLSAELIVYSISSFACCQGPQSTHTETCQQSLTIQPCLIQSNFTIYFVLQIQLHIQVILRAKFFFILEEIL